MVSTAQGQAGRRQGIKGCTWFMPRTICWNLAERFMRAQPPPWERQAAGVKKGRTQAGPNTLAPLAVQMGKLRHGGCHRSPVTGAGARLGPRPLPHPYSACSGALGPSGRYLLVHEIDGAANVDIHEIHLNGAVQQLSALGHGVRKGTLQLWWWWSGGVRASSDQTCLALCQGHQPSEVHQPAVPAHS